MALTRQLYTDGACSGNPGPGGWAVVGDLDGEEIYMYGGEDNTTNNRMELTGILKAYECGLEFARRQIVRTSTIEITIASDSAYGVNAIQKGWVDKWMKRQWKTTNKTPVKNQDLWTKWLELDRASRAEKVRFNIVKVKGHDGDALNEAADSLARDESIRRKQMLEQQTNS